VVKSRRVRLSLAAAALAVSLGTAACGGAAAAGKRPTSTERPSTSSPSTSSSSSSSSSSTSTSRVSTTTSAPEARLPQPTAAHPLSILDIGDSLGEDLGFGLANEFGSDPWVSIIQAAKGDTGLARPDFYDWPAALEDYLQQYRPGAVVVFLGANDGQGFVWQGNAVEFGTPVWLSVYTDRVDSMMSECQQAGAKVLWVGMPVMGSPTEPYLTSEMQTVDGIYQAQAAKYPSVTYFSSWPLFSTPSGQYTSTVEVNGQLQDVRDADGIHLDNAGDELLSEALVPVMEKAWNIGLFPPPS
jgi:hypothetical protein